MHRCRIVLAALLVVAPPVAAQRPRVMPDTTIHVLQIPEHGKPYMCREDTVMPPALKAHHGRAWEFVVGKPGNTPEYFRPRSIHAQFDSAGTPLMLTDMVILVPVRNEQAMMLFTTDTLTWGIMRQTHFDSTSVARMESLAAVGRFGEFDKVMPPAEKRSVTVEEEQRARKLMGWLWDHRCSLHSANAHRP